MAVDSVEPLACPSCGYRLKSSDTFEVNPDLGYPEEDFKMLHCICYLCGNEWVE